MARGSIAKQAALATLLVTATVLFVALGVWQVQRRAWKLDLIAGVEQRIYARAQPAPGPASWRDFSVETAAYIHVDVSGTLLNDREIMVQAVTELGAGFWVMTPLRADDGWIVLINRGFVPQDRRVAESGRNGEPSWATVTGLLRAPEPGGAFLRSNDPANDRWFSRDVEAIAASRDLGVVAPYFIDADSTPNPGGFPVGGLTVVAFRNTHLVYALTWFSLAGLSGAGLWIMRHHHAGRGEN
ncbi:MAG: SURF1 family protein [Janthinobacterium lividum]